MTIWTYGYRERAIADLVRRCDEHGIKSPFLVDVRRRASGRYIAKDWTSEAIIERLMPHIGWRDDYIHRPLLGNYQKSSVWKPHPDAWRALIELANWWTTRTDLVHYPQPDIIMLCCEVDAMACHRTEVAGKLAGIVTTAGGECNVVHLP